MFNLIKEIRLKTVIDRSITHLMILLHCYCSRIRRDWERKNDFPVYYL